MIYNKLSGSTINNNSELFDRFKSNECFLTFARSENVWGELSLVNISIPPTKSITDLFTTSGTNTFPFYDVMESSNTLSKRTVFVYRTTVDISDFPTTNNVELFTKINRAELSQEPIYLEYMNANWCQLKNLPPNYADLFPLTENGISYKYYLFPQQQFYSTNPVLMNVQNKNYFKINLKSKFGSNTLNENVRLKMKDPVSNTEVYVFGSDYLTKTTTILGETFVIGLTGDIIARGFSEQLLLTYANNTPSGSTRNTKPYFFLEDSQGNVKSSRMYLQSYSDLYKNRKVYFLDSGDSSKYLLFQNETINSQTTAFEYYYSKITLEQTYDGLAIYNETLPFVYSEVDSPANVTDSNPPALDVNYLKTSTVSKSLFDVRGYMRIKNDEFKYCRQMLTSQQRALYVDMGFGETKIINPTRYFESVEITSITPFKRYSNLVRTFTQPTSGRWIFYLFNNTFLPYETITLQVPNGDDIDLEIADSNFELNYIECNVTTARSGITVPRKLIEANGSDTADIYLKEDTYIINKIEYAICEDYDDALEFQMDSVMIEKSVPNKGTGLYEGLYRSLAICYKPSFYDGTNIIDCSTYINDETLVDNFIESVSPIINLYNPTKKRYETGSVLYVANKTPIYRKYIDNNVPEVFKIIV
jgi:hypothetical protein